MIHAFRLAWTEMVLPILKRPKRLQVAALCYRDTAEGKRVLLITSRDTGRWIVPKGWPRDGRDGPRAALQEAWEEAGVRKAEIESDPVGFYYYAKGMTEGLTIPVEAQVYLTRVKELGEDYPEADVRKRAWFTPERAAELVEEPDLQDMLRAL